MALHFSRSPPTVRTRTSHEMRAYDYHTLCLRNDGSSRRRADLKRSALLQAVAQHGRWVMQTSARNVAVRTLRQRHLAVKWQQQKR